GAATQHSCVARYSISEGIAPRLGRKHLHGSMAPTLLTQPATLMRIAQVSPLYESVPPQAYGGTERVVSFLTEELVRAGHDVTLFASGDSRTSAHLVPIIERALRLDSDSTDSLANHVLMLEYVMRDVDAF